ncbi:uncharacterized protein LOC142985406 [Anticarsia gemmatalis]|uniref:uncharacterized protein LOC142985406 n=1 Tax=Anticarsia gemmatalis TaxID=129554 RepID=UPI003F760E63
MSTKNSKKNATKTSTAIITRNKSAQQTRQLRAKTKKVKQTSPKQPSPVPTKEKITPEKSTKSATHQKDTPLKTKVRNLVKLVEQVEYYPDKLKRDVCVKKISLEPKHNFKVVASTNKRKLGVPQRGGTNTPPLKKQIDSTKAKNSELSMADLVRIMEDTQTLSEEDFMEILTCPSPVWWEDPPDDEYIEDAIDMRPPDPVINVEEKSETSRTNTPTRTKSPNAVTIDSKELKSPKTEKFNNKKRKLESVLGNIKNGKICNKNSVVNNCKRKLSQSTDGEEFLDLSFSEEDILKNLENMNIPIEQADEQNGLNIVISDVKSEKVTVDTANTVKTEKSPVKSRKNAKPRKSIVEPEKIPPKAKKTVVKSRNSKGTRRGRPKNETKVPTILPTLTKKPVFLDKKSSSTDSNTDYNIDSFSSTNFRFINDDDINAVTETDITAKNFGRKSVIVDSSSFGESSIDIGSVEDYEIKKETIESVVSEKNDTKKVTNDLSEYITVYKIMSSDLPEKNEHNTESVIKCTENTKNKFNNAGKLNSFFKKCKSNKRLKKSDSSFPANFLTDVKEVKKMEKENDTSIENCEYCISNIEHGINNYSCDKCVKTTFSCDSCNFHADTKEIYKKHISSCKDVPRISWNHNYLINQT